MKKIINDKFSEIYQLNKTKVTATAFFFYQHRISFCIDKDQSFVIKINLKIKINSLWNLR